MKRFISALAFCTFLLVVLGFILFPRAEAKIDPLRAFLDQPAPHPPNPLVKTRMPPYGNMANMSVYDREEMKPPADDAPIEVLISYWSTRAVNYSKERHMPRPSDAVLERFYAEIAKDARVLPRLLYALPDDGRTAELAQQIYEREGTGGVFAKGQRNQIKEWLINNSPSYSGDLVRRASSVREDGEYLTNHEDLLALTRIDYAQAKPIIDRLYSDSSQKVPQVLAKWARYRHALQTDSTSDIDTYRDELKAVVEDKTATPAMRDLAMDAIAREKSWPGRDDWYYSLLGDETLADLRVNGRSFTGLTTMLLMSPDDKYVDKMLELARSENKTVRAAAVRNLTIRLNTRNPEILRALLPWLDDPKWVPDYNGYRSSYINMLASQPFPEAVPGLIRLIDEQADVASRQNANNAANRPIATTANTASNAASAVANAAASAAADAMARAARMIEDQQRFPYRNAAIEALARQKDSRAVPTFRRLLNEIDLYGRTRVVNAILECNGFTLQEQLDGLETAAKSVKIQMDAEEMRNDPTLANTAANAVAIVGSGNRAYKPASIDDFEVMQITRPQPISPEQLRGFIGQGLLQRPEISDELAEALVDKIEAVEPKEPAIAAAYRRMILNWNNSAINKLLLRDLKRGIADVSVMNRLIAQRAELREKHSAELIDLRRGKGAAAGFASCMFESRDENVLLMESDDEYAKIALLGCARLIRAPLPVLKVAAELRSQNALLKLAAERYLESEDSRESRDIVRAAPA
ncbi:MAG: hypothetical protein QM785_20100 [Pyrinomonadaceae bacterium]